MKIPNKYAILICITLCIISFVGVAKATQPELGEEALFTTSTAPDALILLDLSGSMRWAPPGEDMYINSSQTCLANDVPHYNESGPTHTKKCTISAYGTVPYYGDASCSGPFYVNSGGTHTTNCRRVVIARRAIFDILDDNDDNTINSQDEGSLGVRVGYMRFTDGNDTDGSYSSGNNKLIKAIGSKYSQIFCGSNSSCLSTSYCTSNCVNNSNEPGNSGTPLAAALHEAKLYLDAHKAADTYRDCRQKFVILISDGADTYACGGGGSEDQADQYKRRRESVAKAKALADAGYRVFVIGFGAGMPDYLKNTLNWMAYYGGTDNPNQVNSGSTSAYDPSAVTSSCVTSATTGTCDGTSTNCFATSNDPGNTPLSGYAFLASDADQLAAALKTAMNLVREATYSFSQSSVQSSRTQDENFLYEGSFQPRSDDPFWYGHLKKYQINEDGTVGAELWDAADVLQVTSASLRTMFTYKGGSLVPFTATYITPSDLGVSTTTERDNVLYYIRGESAYNPDSTTLGVFKLGDVFRSTPITVGTPSAFFDDIRDTNNAFATHRANHPRSSANGYRLIVVGANDGQMHAFLTSTGAEAWSFIPPNLLPKLKNITHKTHPTALPHQYFVDGPVTVADVWLGTGDGRAKNAADWHTIMVFGEGRGGTPNLWSSSPYCDSGFSATYSSSYPYYCGYYALNLDNSLNPSFMWMIRPNSAQAPYMGDPWSKMMTGRVRYSSGGSEVEKWVGFIGAGYNAADCKGGGGCDTRGKGFYVVDLSNGQVLWSYTRADNAEMNYSVPGSPAIVDTDNDGFVDTAYIGDMGGNMWRFKFCQASQMPSCSLSDWSGGQLYSASSGEIRPIYTMPAVARDGGGNLWVYWGTGNKADPIEPNAQEKFFALKDNDRTTTYRVNDLENITASGKTYDQTTSTRAGYYMNLPGSGQKILADPAVFGGVVYFTSYNPPSGNNPCEQGGEASLFAIKYTSGGGAFPGGSRSMTIGTGIASAPILSLKPGGSPTPDLYVTVSGGGGRGASTFRVNIDPPGLSNRTNILYWRDRRLQ